MGHRRYRGKFAARDRFGRAWPVFAFRIYFFCGCRAGAVAGPPRTTL
jgi:hypothetical protein